MPTFAEREEPLRQRAARLWFEDEDIAVCIAEIDRLVEYNAQRDIARIEDAEPVVRAAMRVVEAARSSMKGPKVEAAIATYDAAIEARRAALETAPDFGLQEFTRGVGK